MTVSISGSTPALLSISISDFVYPISKLSSWPATGGTNITIADSGGTATGVASNAKITNVNSGAITTITINYDTSKPNVGEKNATIFISLNVPHQVPIDGFIEIFFPTQPVTGNEVVVNPTCAQSGGTMSSGLSCSYSSSTHIVTLTNILAVQKSGEFNFTVSGITNPISVKTVTGINIKTKTADNGDIDTGSGSWGVPNPNTITGASWSISGASTKVSTLTSFALIFNLTVPVEAN